MPAKTLKLRTDEYYERHVMLVNAILGNPLTGREVEVLGIVLHLQDQGQDPFSRENRALIKKKLKIESANLSNFIRGLVSKKFMKRGSDAGGKAAIIIAPGLSPGGKEEIYQFKLIHDNERTGSKAGAK